MLKMSASFVLASLRGSTYRSVRLASSLAAAALDGHFEHPVATLTRSSSAIQNVPISVPTFMLSTTAQQAFVVR